MTISKPRIFCFIFVAIVSACVFIYRLIDWQVINGENLRLRANSSKVFRIKMEPARGEILDRNGISLAVNDVTYQTVFDRYKIQKGNINSTINYLLDIFEKRKQKFIDDLPLWIEEDMSCGFLEDKVYDKKNTSNYKKEIEILKSKDILDLNEYATAKDCVANLFKKFGLEGSSFSVKRKRDIASVRYGMEKTKHTSPDSYVFAEDLDKDSVIVISELSIDYPCFRVSSKTKRGYRNSSLVPHILGNVSKLDQKEYQENKENGYKLNDRIGKFGIEKAFESELRGKRGSKIVETNITSEIISQKIEEEVEHGHTVFLTIDAHLQKVLNDSLANHVRYSQGKKAGAAVVLDLKDFSILAASTYPSYDIARYSEDSDYRNKLLSDNNKSLINLCFEGIFEPGSSFKPLTTLACLQEKVISKDTNFYCSGRWYLPGSGHFARCMGVHRNIGLTNAIARSCNAYFMECGHRLGHERLNKYAEMFGLGVKTGIEIFESKGRLTSEENAEEIGSQLFPTSDSEAAIGQALDQFSPLQLAVYAATIATNGKRYEAHLVDRITDYSRQNTLFKKEPKILSEAPIDIEHFKELGEGMLGSSNFGTSSRSLRGYDIRVASKTGTSENPSNHDHKTMIGYAPYDKPEIAISVVIPEEGTWIHNYQQVFKETLDAYFKKKGMDAELEQ